MSFCTGVGFKVCLQNCWPLLVHLGFPCGASQIVRAADCLAPKIFNRDLEVVDESLFLFASSLYAMHRSAGNTHVPAGGLVVLGS